LFLLSIHSEILLTFSTESLSEMRLPWLQDSLSRSNQDLIMLDRHTLPAFVSPGLQHETTTASLHSGSESMGFSATAIVRLVCPLWHSLCSFENFKFSTEAFQKAWES